MSHSHAPMIDCWYWKPFPSSLAKIHFIYTLWQKSFDSFPNSKLFIIQAKSFVLLIRKIFSNKTLKKSNVSLLSLNLDNFLFKSLSTILLHWRKLQRSSTNWYYYIDWYPNNSYIYVNTYIYKKYYLKWCIRKFIENVIFWYCKMYLPAIQKHLRSIKEYKFYLYFL